MHTLHQSSPESSGQAAYDLITTPALAKGEMHCGQSLTLNITVGILFILFQLLLEKVVLKKIK